MLGSKAGYQRLRDRATMLARDLLVEGGRQLRIARLGAGLSQAAVGHAAGVSTAMVSRVERALVPGVSITTLARLYAAVGLRLSVKGYPEGDPIRDRPQLRVLDRFRRLLPRGSRWATEVPLPIPGDRRAWDAMTGAGDLDIGVEAETAITDAQAMLRKSQLKQRDGMVDRMVIVVADTRRNRAAVAAARGAFRDAFPIDARAFLRALHQERDPGGNALIFV